MVFYGFKRIDIKDNRDCFLLVFNRQTIDAPNLYYVDHLRIKFMGKARALPFNYNTEFVKCFIPFGRLPLQKNACKISGMQVTENLLTLVSLVAKGHSEFEYICNDSKGSQNLPFDFLQIRVFASEKLHLVFIIFTLRICHYNAHTKIISTAITLIEAPKLDFSKLPEKELRLRAGEPTNIEIRTSGFPFPRIDWNHDGKCLPSSDRVGQTTGVLIINISCYDFKPIFTFVCCS